MIPIFGEACHCRGVRRDDICLYLGRADLAQLEALCAKPKPFTWTKTAEDILTREQRALAKLDEIRGNR